MLGEAIWQRKKLNWRRGRWNPQGEEGCGGGGGER